MSRVHCLVVLSLGLVLASSAVSKGGPSGQEPKGRPKKAGAARVDLHGEPLPHGVLCRLGTNRFRSLFPDFALSADGKTLALRNYHSVQLWDVASGKSLAIIKGDDEYVDLEIVGFAPNDKSFCTSEDGTMSLWAVPSGKRLWQMSEQETGSVRGVFTPDGKHLVSWGPGRPVRLWNAADGKMVREHKLPEGLTDDAVIVSPDGKMVAGAVEKQTVRVWEVLTGKLLHTLGLQAERAERLVFSPDSKALAAVCGDRKVIRLFALASGKERRIVLADRVYINGVKLTEGGKVVAAETERKEIRLWDGGTGEQVRAFPSDKDTEDFLLSPDGKKLAVREKGAIHLWEVATGKSLWRPPARVGSGGPFAFVAGGKTLIAKDGKAVRFWDVASGKEQHGPQGHTDHVRCLAFAPGGAVLATGSLDGLVRIWETTTGKPLAMLAGHRGSVLGVAVSADGKVAASHGQDGMVRIWEVATGRQRFKFRQDSFPFGRVAGAVPNIASGLSPDGKTVGATNVGLATIGLWDTATGRQREVLKLEGPVTAFAFSPDGKALAAGQRGSVELWDIVTGRRLRKVGGDGSQGIVFAPDGKVLATRSGKISLWEVATTGEMATLTQPENATALTFTPSGGLLALQGPNEPYFFAEKIDLWDVATGKRVASLQVPDNKFLAQAMSADGTLLATAMNDTTVLVWDLRGLASRGKKAPTHLGDKELDRLWVELADKDARRGHQASQALKASSAHAVALLKQRLRPVATDSKRLARLIGELDSNSYRVRRRATVQLENLGELAETALREALASKPTLEVRMRLAAILTKLDGPVRSVNTIRGLRAVRVLEQSATPEARKLLRELAGGPADALLTRDAEAACKRLAGRSR